MQQRQLALEPAQSAQRFGALPELTRGDSACIPRTRLGAFGLWKGIDELRHRGPVGGVDGALPRAARSDRAGRELHVAGRGLVSVGARSVVGFAWRSDGLRNSRNRWPAWRRAQSSSGGALLSR